MYIQLLPGRQPDELLPIVHAGHNMGDASKYGYFSVPGKSAGERLAGLPANARVLARREGKLLRVPTHEQLLPELLTHVPDAGIRRQVSQLADWLGREPVQSNGMWSQAGPAQSPVGRGFLQHMTHHAYVLQAYQVGYTSPQANVGVVQRLLDTRQEIAELLGSPSYAHYQAGRDTLAHHPAAISAFLKGGCAPNI